MPWPYVDAERIKFPKWLSMNFPSIGYEDWTISAYERGKRGLGRLDVEKLRVFEEWEKKGIYPPDYKIYKKDKFKYLCWIDVKWTSKIDNSYNLNWDRHKSYAYVSRETSLPVYLVIFTGKPCNDSPSAYGYIDPEKDNLIPLSEIEKFKEELSRLIHL